MTGMDDLTAWLRAIWDARERELDEDERWARAANQRYPYATEGAAPDDGVHWRWVAGDNWDTVTIDPVIDEFVAEPGYPCWLATVETWNSGTIALRQMPRTYADSIVEMDASAAGHIARQDPHRVLRDVARERADIDAKRKLLDLHAPFTSTWTKHVQCSHCAELCHSRSGLGCDSPDAPHPCPTVRLLAQPYADQPGYREEWRP